MHSTGIFSWEYLFELGQNREKYWRDYLDELAEKGLSRASAAHRRRWRLAFAPVFTSLLRRILANRVTVPFNRSRRFTGACRHTRTRA
jgi:hypothetical protein